MRYWNEIKHIFCCLQGIINLELFYSKETTSLKLVGYINAMYKSDPHKACSQTNYLCYYNDTIISWRSTKKTLVATFTHHYDIIVLYEVDKEFVWLRFVISHIPSICQITPVNSFSIIIYEDNVVFVTKVRGGYIKGDKTKHISLKFFYIYELQESRQIDVKQIHSTDNLADLFTKSLLISTFEKLIYSIGMWRINKLRD